MSGRWRQRRWYVSRSATWRANIFRLNIYTADVDAFFAAEHTLQRLFDGGCRYTSTLVEVARLAFPDLLVEIEATAVV